MVFRAKDKKIKIKAVYLFYTFKNPYITYSVVVFSYCLELFCFYRNDSVSINVCSFGLMFYHHVNSCGHVGTLSSRNGTSVQCALNITT